jgi:hypothetical protein
LAHFLSKEIPFVNNRTIGIGDKDVSVGHCQVVESLAILRQNNPDSVLFSVGTRNLSPVSESSVAEQAMMLSLEVVSANTEQILNLTMDVEKSLSLSD